MPTGISRRVSAARVRFPWVRSGSDPDSVLSVCSVFQNPIQAWPGILTAGACVARVDA